MTPSGHNIEGQAGAVTGRGVSSAEVEGGAMGAARNESPLGIYQAGAAEAGDFEKNFLKNSEPPASNANQPDADSRGFADDAPPAPPSPEVLKAFCDEWGMVSPRIRFEQKWVDRETAEIVDFAEISDEDELLAASARAEEQYLNEIAARRGAYVRTASKKYGAVGPEGRTWEEEFTRELAKKDLYFLTKYVLKRNKLSFHLHYFMAESVSDQRLVSNTGMRYKGLREFPRESYKSTVMGLGKCVQLILNDPDVTILYISAIADNAQKKLGEVRGYFRYGTLLSRLFPEHAWSKKMEEGPAGRWVTPARDSADPEGTIEAAGATTSLASRHYKFIIADDMWDDKSVTSREVTAAVNQKIQGIDYLLADQKEGKILFVGTRFAHDDPTMGLLEDPMCDSVIAGGVMKCGRSLFPENLPLVWMYQQSITAKYVFTCQIILWPKSEDRGLNPEQLQMTKWSDLKKQAEAGQVSYRLWVLTDAGAQDKSDGDPASIGIVAVTSDHRYCLVELVRRRMDPAVFIDECERIWDRWQPYRIVRQKTLLELTIMSFVRRRNADRQEKNKSRMIFHDYPLAKREKKSRITAALQPILGRGQLHVDPDIGCLRVMKDEMREHPLSKNDDIIDMLSELDDPAVSRWPEAPKTPAAQPLTVEQQQPHAEQLQNMWNEAKKVDAGRVLATRQNRGVSDVYAGLG